MDEIRLVLGIRLVTLLSQIEVKASADGCQAIDSFAVACSRGQFVDSCGDAVKTLRVEDILRMEEALGYRLRRREMQPPSPHPRRHLPVRSPVQSRPFRSSILRI